MLSSKDKTVERRVHIYCLIDIYIYRDGDIRYGKFIK